MTVLDPPPPEGRLTAVRVPVSPLSGGCLRTALRCAAVCVSTAPPLGAPADPGAGRRIAWRVPSSVSGVRTGGSAVPVTLLVGRRTALPVLESSASAEAEGAAVTSCGATLLIAGALTPSNAVKGRRPDALDEPSRRPDDSSADGARRDDGGSAGAAARSGADVTCGARRGDSAALDGRSLDRGGGASAGAACGGELRGCAWRSAPPDALSEPPPCGVR